MLRSKLIITTVCLFLPLFGYAQGEINKTALRRIGDLSARISELCDSISFYQSAIESDKNEIIVALAQIEAYSKKPFSEMSLSKVSALPDEYLEIKEAFYKYNHGRELLAGELDEKRIKETIKSFRFKSLNETQNRDIKQLRELLDIYEHCGDDIIALVSLKNRILENYVKNNQSLTKNTWGSLKQPWNTVDPGDYKQLKDRLQELERKYSQIPFVANWLKDYSNLLFEKKVLPFTPIPDDKFQQTYATNKIYIDLDESLINKERIFIK